MKYFLCFFLEMWLFLILTFLPLPSVLLCFCLLRRLKNSHCLTSERWHTWLSMKLWIHTSEVGRIYLRTIVPCAVPWQILHQLSCNSSSACKQVRIKQVILHHQAIIQSLYQEGDAFSLKSENLNSPSTCWYDKRGFHFILLTREVYCYEIPYDEAQTQLLQCASALC